MRICISSKAIEKNGITMSQFFYLLIRHYMLDVDKAKEELFHTNKIDGLRSKEFPRITSEGYKLISNILADSEDYSEEEDEELVKLSKELKEIFPKGKKEGTNYYWSDGIPMVVRRLKLFFKKYGRLYNNDQIIQAAKKYVEGFNGNYQFMKLLKYFIFKEKIGAAGDVEGESELINYIENAGQEENLKNDWTSTLV